jgi:protein TonB
MSAGPRELWGDPNSLGGGAVGVNIVKQVPLPSRAGLVNPLANDTESAVPQPPPKSREAQKTVEEPDAVPIKSRNAQRRLSDVAASRQQYRGQADERPNQLHSSTGQAMVSPLYGMTGSGGVGTGSASPFGNRFGYYVELLRQKVAEKWRTGDVDARLSSAPPAIVTFTILRDGTARDIKVAQRSGNSVLDTTAMRAIYEASPFPPLPAGYERSEANIEFWFQLKR